LVRRGTLILGGAFVCFYFGLDENWDYLRLFHGMWHMLVGIHSFYTW